jgi:hypothetical protein
MKAKNLVVSLVLISIGAGLWWGIRYSRTEPWDDENYFIYLALAGFAAGLCNAKPWGAGLFLVAAPLGASIWRSVTVGWSKFGPIEQFWFVVLGGFVAVSAFIGNLVRSSNIRAKFKKALFGPVLFLAFSATAYGQTYWYEHGYTVALPTQYWNDTISHITFLYDYNNLEVGSSSRPAQMELCPGLSVANNPSPQSSCYRNQRTAGKSNS